MFRRTCALSLVLLSTTHCATMFHGHRAPISVNSSVTDAEVILDGEVIGRTPLSVEVTRRKSGTLTVRKDGYTPVQLLVSTTWSNAFIWGDIVAWGIFLGIVPGLVSTTVDAASENMYEFSPSNYYADLRPITALREPSLLDQKRAALVKFCLTSYQSLGRELAQGSGEHLQALCQLADLGDGCWKDAESFGQLWHKAASAPAFAMAVAKLAMQAADSD